METISIGEYFGKDPNVGYLYIPYKDTKEDYNPKSIIDKISAQMATIKSTKIYDSSNVNYLANGAFAFDKLESARFCATETSAEAILICEIDKQKVDSLQYESVLWFPFEKNVTEKQVRTWRDTKAAVQYYNVKRININELTSVLNSDMKFVNVNIGSKTLDFRYRDVSNKVLCHDGIPAECTNKVKKLFPSVFGA